MKRCKTFSFYILLSQHLIGCSLLMSLLNSGSKPELMEKLDDQHVTNKGWIGLVFFQLETCNPEFVQLPSWYRPQIKTKPRQQDQDFWGFEIIEIKTRARHGETESRTDQLSLNYSKRSTFTAWEISYLINRMNPISNQTTHLDITPSDTLRGHRPLLVTWWHFNLGVNYPFKYVSHSSCKHVNHVLISDFC